MRRASLRYACSDDLAKDCGASPKSIQRNVRYSSLHGLRRHSVRHALNFYFSRHLDRFLAENSFSSQTFLKVADRIARLSGEDQKRPIDPKAEEDRREILAAFRELIPQSGKTQAESVEILPNNPAA